MESATISLPDDDGNRPLARGALLTPVRRIARWCLPVAILCPSLAWLALDRSVWPWDQAWYASHTLELFETLRSDPLAWPDRLWRATPSKPPAMVWIGQLSVPLGSALGSVDDGLLLSVWATHLAALLLVFRALLELSGGRTLIAVAGALVTGAAPIFIVLTTQYLAEASQTLAVAWFVLIMARAPRWSRSMLAAQLAAATAFAMLAKTTSPLYCAAPGLIALVQLIRRSSPRPAAGASEPRWWALAVVLAGAAVVWYDRNFEAVAHHATTAAFGPVAEFYGRRDSLARGIVEWGRTASAMFFLQPVAALVPAVVLLGAAKRLLGRRAMPVNYPDICAAAAFVQVLVALVVFALSPNRDPRYAAPLLPLVAVMVSWAILHSGAQWVASVVTGALALQLLLVQTQVLGIWPARAAILQATLGVAPAMSVVHGDRRPAADLAAIVQRTCGHNGSRAYNFVGVDLLHLSGHALTHAAAKERLAGRAGECRYDSIGFGSVEAAEAEVNARPYLYWINVDPQIHPVPGYHEFLNRSAPVVFGRLRHRGDLEPEPWDGPKGVLLFRFVKR